MAKKTKKDQTGTHGGFREGSGKPTFFRGKYSGDGKKASIQMSEEAFDLMDDQRDALTKELQARPGKGFPREVSRNTYLEALIRKAGKGLTVADIFRLDK